MVNIENGTIYPLLHKMIVLPRQARDKHRESTQKLTRFCRHCVDADGTLKPIHAVFQVYIILSILYYANCIMLSILV